MAEKKTQKHTKRKDGLYHVECRYKLPDGTRGKKSFYGKTQSEANTKREEFKRQLRKRIVIDNNILVKDYAKKWLQLYAPAVKPQTLAGKETDVQSIIALVGNKPIATITRSDVQSIINTRAGMSHSYVQKLRVSCHQLFTAAVMDGILERDPCVQLKLPTYVKGSHRPLTDYEMSLLTSHYHEAALGDYAMVLAFSGLRPSEGRAIRKKHIDLEKRTITVEETLSYVKGHIYHGLPKSTASYRTIPILDIVFPILQRLMSEKEDYLFTSKAGTCMSSSCYKGGMKRLLDTLSYYHHGYSQRGRGNRPWDPIYFTAYDLRHTFCTYCRDSGVDIKICMQWMGHTDSDLIMEIYDHGSSRRETQAITNMNTFVGNCVGKSEIATI